jgi:dTDP-4-dehydrorhamnose 3,5-epimerase
MKVSRTVIPDVVLIDLELHEDDRGFFVETYHHSSYVELGLTGRFVQDNHSRSKKGTLRGLHYQIRQPQGKLVWPVTGEIYDVAVDLRRSSPTLGKWVGARLKASDHRQIWVPPGFAHGLYVISDWADVLYKVTDEYAPEWERTLKWDDPQLGIEWPLPEGSVPLLSMKDAMGTEFHKADLFE